METTPPFSNPNLLINGDFQIWQRGESISTGSWGYTADRWFLTYGNANNGVNISKQIDTDGSIYAHFVKTEITNNIYFAQRIDNFCIPSGTKVTLSFWAKGTNGGIISVMKHYERAQLFEEDTKLITLSSEWQKFELVRTISSTVSDVKELMFCINNTTKELDIKEIKVEVGEIATPFVPRPYPQELAMCQRYTYLYAPVNYTAFDYFYNNASTNRTTIGIPLTFNMRATPSFQYKNGTIQRLANKNSQQTANAIAIGIDVINSQTLKLVLTFGTNMPTSSYIEFYPIDDFKMLLDAEIY